MMLEGIQICYVHVLFFQITMVIVQTAFKFRCDRGGEIDVAVLKEIYLFETEEGGQNVFNCWFIVHFIQTGDISTCPVQ